MTTYSSMQNMKSPSPSRNLLWNPDQTNESEWADSTWDTSSSSDKRCFKTLAWNVSSNNMINGEINHLNTEGSGIPNYPNVSPVEVRNNPNSNTVNFRTDSHLAYHTGFTFEDAAMQDPDFGTSLGSPMTFSFWVKSTVAGTYVVELSSNSYFSSGFPPSEFRYACSKQYTINSADTWEKKILTFPAYSSSNMAGFSAYGSMFFVVTFWLAGGTNYTSGTLNSSYTSIAGDNTGRAVGLNSNFATAGNGKWHLAMPQLECSPLATQFTITPSKSFSAIKKSCISSGTRQPWPGGIMGDFSNASQSYLIQPFSSLGAGNPNLGLLQTKATNFWDKTLNLKDNTTYNLGNNSLYKSESGDSSSSATTVQYLSNNTLRLSSQLPGVNRSAMLALYQGNQIYSGYFFDLTE